MDWTIIITILCSIFASSGFWAWMMSRGKHKTSGNKLLIGLGHDRIMSLGMTYIDRGWITRDEYENLYVYLFVPYKELGGNGSAERIMKEVDKLPIHD